MMSDNQKIKISNALKNNPILECPYCLKSINGAAFRFYHFKNCKNAKKNI